MRDKLKISNIEASSLTNTDAHMYMIKELKVKTQW